MEVSDISTSGISVYENPDEGILMQGMIIPEVIIEFSGALRIKCAAQVIYRREEMGNGLRCGFAILDMNIYNYNLLTNILTNALDHSAYVSKKVDMDALWEFLFETGFIYPKKYRIIESYRDDFKETYRKLYQDSPDIATNFIYEENGRIYGHILLVKAYEKAWMVQHHAARTMNSKLAGLKVLYQIMHYLYGMYRLPSTGIDYVICYFRPESKFPAAVFGGFTKALKNIRGCSLDLFSYLPYTTLSLGTQLPYGWLLKECSSQDLWELSRFYRHYSGGLLMDVLCPRHEISSNKSIEKLYDRLGFFRRWKAYSLNREGELNAVLIVNRSNLGFNLSELLNSIKILVTNPEGLPWDILSTAIGQLAPLYDMQKVPILIYPMEYVHAKGIPYEKQYQLWILSVQFFTHFGEFVQRKFKVNYWKQ